MLSCYINHANNVLLLILMHSVRGNQRGNHEWTFQRYWQQCSHMAQDEDKQSTKTIQYRKLKRWATRIPIKIWGEPILLAKDIDLYTLICIVRYQSNIHKTPVKYKFLKLKIVYSFNLFYLYYAYIFQIRSSTINTCCWIQTLVSSSLNLMIAYVLVLQSYAYSSWARNNWWHGQQHFIIGNIHGMC